MDGQSKSMPPEKKENVLLSLVLNIALPAIILSKGGGYALPDSLASLPAWMTAETDIGTTLSPASVVVIAFLFPLAYGITDFFDRRQTNFLSVLGCLNVLLSGGLGLLAVDGFWFAVKEAAIPSAIGIVVLLSMRGKRPLVKMFLYNDNIIDTERVKSALETRGNTGAFDRLLDYTTYLLAGSFFLSAVLNFLLARLILKSPGGTAEFNEELGRMTYLSYPVIVLPCMIVMGFALWRLIGGIKTQTGLNAEEIFRSKS